MGFFRSLFDLSLTQYVTVRLARWGYVLTLVLAALVCLGGIAVGLAMASRAGAGLAPEASLYELRLASEAKTQGYLVAAGSPIAAFFLLLTGRLAAEMTVVVFSIAEALRGRQ